MSVLILFPCFLQHLGVGNCNSLCIYSLLEFGPLIAHALHNIWELLFFILDGILQYFGDRPVHLIGKVQIESGCG